MFILRLFFCLVVVVSVSGVNGMAMVGKRTDIPKATPLPAPGEGFLKDAQALGLDQADVTAQFITLIKVVTETVTGPCTATPVAVSYVTRDEKAKVWVALNHGDDAINELEARDEELEVKQVDFAEDLCSLLVKYNMPPCPTTTITTTSTLPGLPCPTPSQPILVQNCAPTDPAYKLLTFDDYFPPFSIDSGTPIISPQDPGPPEESFTYWGMKFGGNFSFIHCEANTLHPGDRWMKVCNRNTLDGDYYLSLYSPPGPAPFIGPVKRYMTFEDGRYFHLNYMIISAFPKHQGPAGGGVVSVIIKGFTTDVGSDKNTKAAFIDVRYVRGGTGGGGEAGLKVTYELSFFNLVRVEFVAVEGEWKMSDGENWVAAKWKGKGAPLHIDDIAVCRYF